MKLRLNKSKRISPEFDWITEFICSSSFDPVIIVYCVVLTQYEIMHSKSASSFRAPENPIPSRVVINGNQSA